MKKILITGGNGYIAKSLLGLASYEPCEIKYATRNDFDITNSRQTSKWFEDKNFDAVIHTAVVGGSRLQADDRGVLEMNLRMHYNLLANRDKFNRLISFGSGAELFAPDTPYGMSKKIIANSIKQTANWHNIRIFGVFDENELPTRFIKANILRYVNREPILVHENKVMDFFYMKDLLTLVDYYLTESNPPKETNCSYLEKTTLAGIASYINNLSDHKVPVVVGCAEKFGVYCGNGIDLPINTVGLWKGIQETYRALTSLNQRQ
jgi:GDP-L-fucose synthase